MRAQPNFGHQGAGGSMGFIDAWGDGPMVMHYAGKTWRFEFSEMFGPALLTKENEIAVHQPADEKHPFWLPFRLWSDGGRRCRAVRSKRGKLRFWLCHVPNYAEDPTP